jgi:hypothetical protein
MQGGHGNYLFAGGDSTRLYASDPTGLFVSSDLGDTWTRVAGAFGRVPILALASFTADGQTILYAATTGGAAGATAGSRAAAPGTTRAAASSMVQAGRPSA